MIARIILLAALLVSCARAADLPRLATLSRPQAAPLVSPAQIAGLQRWYDASQETTPGTLATWTDRSGNAVDATSIGTPTLVASVLNGRNIVRFDDSANCHYVLTNVGSTAHTTIAVVMSTSTGYNTYTTVNAALTSFQGFSTSATYGSGAPSQRANNHDDAETPTDGVITSRWYIVAFARNGATRTYEMNGTISPRTGVPAIVAGDTYNFGGVGGNGSFQWTGDIAEMLHWNVELTVGQVGQVTEYLRQKWFPNLIICDGNSLTRGFPSSTGVQSYPGLMQISLGNSYTVQNLGVDGQTIADMQTDFNTQPRPGSLPYARRVYVAWEGANSFGVVDGDEAFRQMRVLCRTARAAGMKVVGVTVTGADNATSGGIITATWQARRDVYNAAMRDASSLVVNGGFLDALADPALNAAILTSWGAVNNPTNYADYIHFTDAGYVLIQGEIQPVVAAVFAAWKP